MVRPGGEELRPDPPAPSLRAQEHVHPPRSPHLAPAPPEADRHGGILAEGRAVVVRHPDLRPLRAGSGVLQILPAPVPLPQRARNQSRSVWFRKPEKSRRAGKASSRPAFTASAGPSPVGARRESANTRAAP